MTAGEFDQTAFDRKKREIQIMLDEYDAEIVAYEAWYRAWEARQPKGFRAVRRKERA